MTTVSSQRAVGTPRVRRGSSASSVAAAAVLALLVGAAALPYVVDPGYTSQLVKLFYLVTLASMWNLLAGYAGMVSIGQQAYIGLGAYGIFVFNDRGVDVWSATVLSALVVALVAWPVSYLAFRLRGGYFAVGTWVIAEVVRLVIVRFDQLGAGHGRGIETITSDPLVRRAYTYWLALAVMVAALIGVYALLRSRLGLDMQATRDNEVAAVSLGVRVTATKRMVFVLAAAGCAAAGAVICISGLGVADPGAIFGVQYSAFMIFMVVIGGIGTLEGPIVGALLYFALDQYLSQSGVWYLVILGVVAIVVALYLPRGLWGTFAHRTGFAVFALRYRVAQPEPEPGSAGRAADPAADAHDVAVTGPSRTGGEHK